MVEKATPELETWQNTGDSRVVLKKFSHAGGLIDEMVGSRRRVTLTTEERMLNSERAATNKQDPFKNGKLSPVRLIETAEDLEEIQSNPNLMSEEDMKELLGGHFKKLEARLGEINSETVLRRLAEVAQEEDVTVGKVRAIQERLAEFEPDFIQHVNQPSVG